MTKNYLSSVASGKWGKIIVAAAAFILLAAAVYGFEYYRLGKTSQSQQSKINSFEACALAGNPIMESYPEQCRTADGRTFTRELSAEEQSKLKPPAGNCKKLGEISQDLDQGISNSSSCCAGLKQILRSSAFDANCVGAWGGSNPYLCLACGDGVCDSKYESKCNCPADCSKEFDGTGIANPASINCQKLGGKVDIRTDQTGGQIGYCIFPNGQECEEWALLHNECSLSPSSQMGILEGKVTVGPICPVERVGVPCPVPEEAYTSREVVVYKIDGTTEVARQHFTGDGSYKFELAPGTYVINTPRQGPGGSKDLPQTVIIKAGETLKLNFDIDTGIRYPDYLL